MADYIKSINSYPLVMDNAAYFGTSSASDSSTTKSVTCANLQALTTGLAITVRFTTANSQASAISLNVNSLGSKTVYVNGSSTSSTNMLLWAAGAIITFVYDGTYWNVASEPRCWYGKCTTSATSGSKTATVNGIVVCSGTRLALGMSNANSISDATLNVSSTGLRSLRYGTGTDSPTTSNGYGWAAGDTVDLVFDGQYWRLADTSALTKLNNL